MGCGAHEEYAQEVRDVGKLMERTELHAAGAMLPVYKDHIDVTAHEFAEATVDAWYYTPLQTKDGFGRTIGDLWVAGDWLFSDFHFWNFCMFVFSDFYGFYDV